VVNPPAKLEVSRSNRSRDMDGVQNVKSRSRDTLWSNFTFFVR